MVFNSNIFLLVFFPIVFGLFWLTKTKRERYVLLTLSGYVFYGYWDWRYCFLLAFSSLFSFSVALLIDRAVSDNIKTLWLVIAIATDLSILGFYKYYNFFATTTNYLIGDNRAPILNIVLPVGISFYTFHTISYVVDVAQRRVRATNNIWEYLTYVGLFSQLVAGPIVRFRQIEQDLENIDGRLSEKLVSQGVGYFAVGMIKKVIIADTIAQYINPMLADYGSLSLVGAWMAALGYTYQLYYDFSGYSDMAVGLGFLFGIRIPLNFNVPYQAHGIQDFWRRWHISLSTWLRDYLYFPLGGNRNGVARTYVNLLLTMLLGGLWHGAAWTFVVWGLYHGILLSVERAFIPKLLEMPKITTRLVTLLLVVIGWVIFRSTDFQMATVWLGKMAGMGTAGINGAPMMLTVFIALCFLASNILPASHEFQFRPNLIGAIACAISLFAAYLFMNGQESVFLYYQF